MLIHRHRRVRVRIRISVGVRVNSVQITARYSHSSRKPNPNPNNGPQFTVCRSASPQVSILPMPVTSSSSSSLYDRINVVKAQQRFRTTLQSQCDECCQCQKVQDVTGGYMQRCSMPSAACSRFYAVCTIADGADHT